MQAQRRVADSPSPMGRRYEWKPMESADLSSPVVESGHRRLPPSEDVGRRLALRQSSVIRRSPANSDSESGAEADDLESILFREWLPFAKHRTGTCSGN